MTTMPDPKTRHEYERLAHVNMGMSGFGVDTISHMPCPGCCARDFMTFKVVDTEKALSEATVCSNCKRGFKMVLNRSPGSVSFRVVQTEGPDLPDYLPEISRGPPMSNFLRSAWRTWKEHELQRLAFDAIAPPPKEIHQMPSSEHYIEELPRLIAGGDVVCDDYGKRLHSPECDACSDTQEELIRRLARFSDSLAELFCVRANKHEHGIIQGLWEASAGD